MVAVFQIGTIFWWSGGILMSSRCQKLYAGTCPGFFWRGVRIMNFLNARLLVFRKWGLSLIPKSASDPTKVATDIKSWNCIMTKMCWSSFTVIDSNHRFINHSINNLVKAYLYLNIQTTKLHKTIFIYYLSSQSTDYQWIHFTSIIQIFDVNQCTPDMHRNVHLINCKLKTWDSY